MPVLRSDTNYTIVPLIHELMKRLLVVDETMKSSSILSTAKLNN
jgi:hypothetical protein